MADKHNRLSDELRRNLETPLHDGERVESMEQFVREDGEYLDRETLQSVVKSVSFVWLYEKSMRWCRAFTPDHSPTVRIFCRCLADTCLGEIIRVSTLIDE
ncbi:hypothetical protein [Pontibaca salina]|uniref:Uncharacterized protein n=1 Tax=Pontibaca salina TaxID=2795731 RepID=A0A934M4I0_9RHOB|nr:hypothetical protein [Pontibaca salina]MBI6630929.1 hypothetical protein [Pontibaca salina]